MGYRIAGWVEFVVEVEYVDDESADYGAFLKGVSELPPLRVEPSSAMAPALGALLPEQAIHSAFVRYAGPPSEVVHRMEALNELCGRVFPRNNL